MNTQKLDALLPVSLFVLCAFSGPAFAGTVSPELSTLPQSTAVQVIVQYSTAQMAAPSIASATSTIGGTTIKLADLPNGSLLQMTPAAALTLSQSAGVTHISVNHTVRTTADSTIPVYDFMPQTLHPNSVAAAGVPSKSGKNIGVAIIDSGIMSSSPDLIGGPIIVSKSFVPD